jgi:hypothetical protein
MALSASLAPDEPGEDEGSSKQEVRVNGLLLGLSYTYTLCVSEGSTARGLLSRMHLSNQAWLSV